MQWKIKKETLEAICLAARNVYPKEFIALLGRNPKTKIIDEIVVQPATFGEGFSSLDLEMLPFDPNIIGSVHSHPTNNNFPSSADKRFFSKTGQIHLIVSYPFNINNFRAFDIKGKEIEIEIVGG
jgi:proteasome lid subunit RPN8/RPN11